MLVKLVRIDQCEELLNTIMYFKESGKKQQLKSLSNLSVSIMYSRMVMNVKKGPTWLKGDCGIHY